MVQSATQSTANARKASHAGDWYTSNPTELNKQLDTFIASAKKAENIEKTLVKAIIGPHAGLDYSGPTGAWSYININPENYRRIILMGPSHYVYLDNCALTKM